MSTVSKRALVTGGAGFLGSHLCARLLADGYDVVALDDLYTGSMRNLQPLKTNPRFLFEKGDVTRAAELPGTFDEIYNLACPASPPHYQARPLFTTMTCINGILACLTRAKRDGARLLHASTSEIYGDPLVHPQTEEYWGNVHTTGIRSCYDEGKRIAETLSADTLRTEDTDVRLVRIFNTYGPNMHPQDGRVVSNFILQALRGEDITIYGDGSQTRSFQYCDDLIEAMRRYMTLDRARVRTFFQGELPVINVGNPNEFTIRALAELVLAKVGTDAKLVQRPLPHDDPTRRRPDITRATKLLDGWQPRVMLSEGLDRTIAYFRGLVEKGEDRG